MSLKKAITHEKEAYLPKVGLGVRNVKMNTQLYADQTMPLLDSLASRLLILLKSLNTNRIQVQAQLSHTRPI